MPPGSASITVTVSDGSATANATFLLTVQAGSSTVTFVANGDGTITPNLGASKLIVGHNYTVTAVPKAGQEFAGWTGSISAASGERLSAWIWIMP